MESEDIFIREEKNVLQMPDNKHKKIRFCFFFHRRSSFDNQQERNLCTVNL